MKDILSSSLESNGILLETYNGGEYYIRCCHALNMDFLIYFDNGVIVFVYDGIKNVSDEYVLSESDAMDFILSYKECFLPIEEAAKEREQEYRIAFNDAMVNKMEKGYGGLY